MDWITFEFEKKQFKLDKRTLKAGGCFHFNKGEYKVESPKTTLKIRELTEDFTDKDIFLDIGTHTGFMSLNAKGQVWAFEPYDETFGILVNNKILNKHPNFVINNAVGNEIYNYYVNINKENSGRNTVKKSNDPKDKKIMKIDDFNFDGTVKLVKIDVEGMDENVLRGMENTILKHKPILIMEQVNKEYLKDLNYIQEGSVENNQIWKPK